VTSNTPSNEDPSKLPNQTGDKPTIPAPVLRENPEPTNASEPIPLALTSIFFVIIFIAGIYLALNSGGFRSDVFSPDLVSWSGAGAGGPAAPVDPKVVGKRIFTQNCIACHQSTGLGMAGQWPPLVASEWVVGGDWVADNHLVGILLHGLQGAIQVKGATYNNAMPQWKQLKDDQIAAVLTYIRSEWGNAAAPISAEYVKSIRDKTTDRTEPWSQKELKAMPAESAATSVTPAAPAPAAPATPAAPAAASAGAKSTPSA
jgi:mono/diheme cytochrome c family protein